MPNRWALLYTLGFSLALLILLSYLGVSVRPGTTDRVARRALYSPWAQTAHERSLDSARDTSALGLPWLPANYFFLDSEASDSVYVENNLKADELANVQNLPFDSLLNKLTEKQLKYYYAPNQHEESEAIAEAVRTDIQDACAVIQRSRGALAQWRAVLPAGAEVLEFHPLPNACAANRAYMVWMQNPLLCSGAAELCCCWESGAFWVGTPHLSLVNTQTGQLVCTTPLEVSFVLIQWPLHNGLYLNDLDNDGCAAECAIEAHWDTRGDGYSTSAYGYHPAYDRIRRLRIRYVEHDFTSPFLVPWLPAAYQILVRRGSLPFPTPIDSGYTYDHPLAFWQPVPNANGQWQTRYYFRGGRHSMSGALVQYNPQTDEYDAFVWNHAPHAFDNPNTTAWEVLNPIGESSNNPRFRVVPLD